MDDSLDDDDMYYAKPSTEIDDGKRKFHFFSVQWDIEHFSRRARKADEEIKSRQFWCHSAAWVLSVFPNGERVNNTVGQVGIYLKKIYPATFSDTHSVVSEIIIDCEDGVKPISKIQHTFEGNSLSCRFPIALLRTTVLRKDSGYSPDDCFTITCHLFLFGEESSEIPARAITRNVKGESPPDRKDAGTNTSSEFDNLVLHKDPPIQEDDDLTVLSKDFEMLHNNQRFTDVILKVKEHEFSAHKVILRGRSKVFEAMFEHDMKENRQHTVDLVDMEADAVKDMLRYIYCGKVRQLSPEEALNLYVAADRYDLQGLVVKCRKIILSGLSIDNICEIAAAADLHSDQLLMDAVKSLLSKDMKEIFKMDKWMKFAKENPNLSLNLIQSVVLSI